MSDSFLSQDEVDALISNVTGEQSTQKVAKVIDPKQPRPYDLTQQERIVRGRMATLEILNDRTGRNLRQKLYNLMRKSPEITHSGVNPIKYSEWLKHLPIPSSYNVLSVKGLKGHSLIIFESSFIFMLMDTLFGGQGQFKTRIEGRDFSSTEQQVISRLVKQICDTLTEAWAPIYPLEFSFLRSEIHSHFASIAAPSEVVLTSKFKVDIGDSSGNFWVCFPYASIEPLKEHLSAEIQNDNDKDTSRWKHVLGDKLIDSPLTVICEIARKTLTLKEVMNLQVGSTIELSDQISVSGYCAGEKIFEGTPGTSHGHYAVEIQSTRTHHIGESHEQRK